MNQNRQKKNPLFKKDVFDKKVAAHIKCGYTKEFAEWKVLDDFNNYLGPKYNKRSTNSDGYFES